MLRVAIRNLIAHKVRTLGLMLTVVLGVSFVVGTYVLTDTITHVFDGIFTDVYAGTDVTVRHSSALGSDAVRPPIPEAVLDTVRTVPGVRVAEGGILATGVDIIDANGHRVGNAQAPTFGATWAQDPSLTPFTLRDGKKPAGSSEVAIDATSFSSGHFQLGDQVLLVTAAGPQHFTLVGVAGFGRASNLAGATISIFDLPTAQALLGRPAEFDSINIAAEPGTSTEVLQQRVAATLTPDQEAITGADLTSESSNTVGSMLGVFRTFMLVFAFVALFVGAFIVYNTYSIVIAERTRELALVRALGASGAGVLLSVLLEALLTGLLAAGVGIGAGVLLATGLRRLLDSFGFGMPSGDLVLLGRTAWVALIGGPAITVLASIVPAWRAARTAPLAAMQESAIGRRAGLGRNLIGGLLTIGGVAAILIGLDRGTLAAVGAGAVSLFIGMAMLAPVLSVPVVAVLGGPIERLRGVTGLLARQNARRNPAARRRPLRR